MSWGPLTFEILCWVGLVAILGYFVALGVRDRRVHPGIWLTLGILTVAWMEAPYDRSMYVQFNPELHRLPGWGPIAATQGGLPVIAPPGYVMYFLGPALVAVAIADVVARRWKFGRPQTLIVVGILVGVVFDGVMQFGQSQLIPLWVFSRTAPGVTVFSGAQQQIPIYDLLAMGSMIMWMTYILGRRGPDGDTLVDPWIRRWATGTYSRPAASAVTYIAVVHLVYLYVYAPHEILYRANMLTETGVLQPFPAIPVQPAESQSHGAVGAVSIMTWLLAGIIGTYLLVARLDPQARVKVGNRIVDANVPAAELSGRR